jgi:hypothetical protein
VGGVKAMDVKFNKKPLQCLRPFYGQLHSQEQTQEVRLPDSCPDIGRVLGCWGQICIRGKEWRSSGMSANGGVAAWVLYEPEDGSLPQVVDVWIPFQCRWDFQEAVDDGKMILNPLLASLDARGISPRKIMVRAEMDVFAQGVRKDQLELLSPGQMPEDVQLLTNSYPMVLPVEAGEKQIQLDEKLLIPGNMPQLSKIVGYSMLPSVLEQKVLGNRLVFRGEGNLEVLYLTENGEIQKWNVEVPFSQYAELDQDYETTASAWVMPILTAMDVIITEDNQLHVQGGIAAQYTIFDHRMVDMVEDAYSPFREISLKKDALSIPALLDMTTVDVLPEGTMQGDVSRVICATACGEQPTLRYDQGRMEIMLEEQYQCIYRDFNGDLQWESLRGKGSAQVLSEGENIVYLWPGKAGDPELDATAQGTMMSRSVPILVQVYVGKPLMQVAEIEIGDYREPMANRPALILRRAGEDSLWELAKHCGSTVQAISEANQLEGEPQVGQILLIPIC